MELELRQNYIGYWESRNPKVITKEEVSEMIVPDACPDILQILDGDGTILLQRRDALDGQVSYSGYVKVNVLYEPDGEGTLCSMETALPISSTVEMPEIHGQTKLIILPHVEKVDIHLLNPRKVLIKVNYHLEVQGYASESMEVVSAVEEEAAGSTAQKVEEYKSYFVAAVLEKVFNYSDVLAMPVGCPDMGRLLRTKADCICNESKVIRSKLIFKGEAILDLLYQGVDEEIHSANFHLPFSQVIDCGDIGEEAISKLHIIYTKISCKAMEEDGSRLSVELELLAQGFLQKMESTEILTDLYSTRLELVPEKKMLPCLPTDGPGKRAGKRAGIDRNGSRNRPCLGCENSPDPADKSPGWTDSFNGCRNRGLSSIYYETRRDE